MNITSESAKNSEVKLTVELTELEFENYYQAALQKLASQVNVKGFRQGHVPLDVAAKELDKEFIMAHAIDMAIPPTYVDAIKQKNIEPIARPRVSILSPLPLKYEAIIPIMPPVTLKDYKKIKLTRGKAEVTEAELKDELKHIQAYHAHFHDADRAAKEGDRVEIDFQGFDEGGAQLEGTTSKNHPIVIGDKSFVPGFEENLVGMKVGEEKEFSVTFPADYFHKPFQNKVVKFKVKANRIEERHLPEMDPKFFKEITGKDLTEEQFLTEIRTSMQRRRQEEENIKVETSFLEQIEKITEVEISDILIEEEGHYMIEEQKQKMSERGMKWEDYLKAIKKTEKEMLEESKPEATKRLKLRFGVQQVLKEEKIEVTPEEIQKNFDDEMKVLASMNFEPKMEEMEQFKVRLGSKLKMEKLIEKFIK